MTEITRTATLSDDGVYRYVLTRRWDSRPMVAWVCLNPSIADADIDDQTCRRIRFFSDREDFGGFWLVNLFALRATQPSALGRHVDPVGPGNDDQLAMLLLSDLPIVCAWGAHPVAHARAWRFRARARAAHRTLRCLGLTRSGAPRHPSRLPDATPLVEYT
jgi:hypothetical protein